MRFEHAHDEAYDDVGGGQVLHSAPGFPGFPPRLAIELFARALQLTGRDRVGLWDPLCGAGGTLATIALLRPGGLTRVLASDVDDAALELATKNLKLTTTGGLIERRQEFIEREVAPDRIRAVDRLLEGISRSESLPSSVARADITDAGAVAALDLAGVEVVMADLPYGQQTDWVSESSTPTRLAFEVLTEVLAPGAIITLSTTERDQFRSLPAATRSFKHGRRHIRMYRVA